jgi:hypothetical protein
MLQTSRINYQKHHEVKEERLEHEEPSTEEKAEARIVASSFAAFLCAEGNALLVSQMLRYRIARTDSLVDNLYQFVHLIKKKPIQFTYSPQYGLSLWPHELGFQRMPAMEEKLQALSHHFFSDYITETTTFLVYHTDFRFKDIFDEMFRQAFLVQSMRNLLRVSLELSRSRLLQSVLKSSLLMLRINEI